MQRQQGSVLYLMILLLLMASWVIAQLLLSSQLALRLAERQTQQMRFVWQAENAMVQFIHQYQHEFSAYPIEHGDFSIDEITTDAITKHIAARYLFSKEQKNYWQITLQFVQHSSLLLEWGISIPIATNQQIDYQDNNGSWQLF